MYINLFFNNIINACFPWAVKAHYLLCQTNNIMCLFSVKIELICTKKSDNSFNNSLNAKLFHHINHLVELGCGCKICSSHLVNSPKSVTSMMMNSTVIFPNR